MKYQKVYVDANVIRDCIKRRKDYSISLMKTMRERKVECITSMFTLLELLRIEKEEEFFYKKVRQGWDLSAILRSRGNLDLNESELNEVSNRLRKFFKEYDFIRIVQFVEDEGWQSVLHIEQTTNLEPADAMHLATALWEKCDLLVTGDRSFLAEATKFLKRNKYTLTMAETIKAEEMVIQHNLQEMKRREK